MKDKRQLIKFILGVSAIVLGTGVLLSFIIVHFVNENVKLNLLGTGSDNFVLYNPANTEVSLDVSMEESSTSVKDATDKVDSIEAVESDQKVSTKKDTVVFEIPDLDIKVPVLEGVDDDTLAVAAGHFPDTGKIGKGNYCIAGHSSNVYACIFNNLKDIKVGMKMMLYDKKGKSYTYFVTENFVVEPDEIWVLDEFFDNRITVVTCTDNGLRRQVVVGLLMSDKEYKDYVKNLKVSKRMKIVGQAQQIADIKISEYLKEVVAE